MRRIAERLRLAGYDVWWDRKLGGGSFFAKEIEEQLSSAGAVVVVWSESAAASHWVVDEASTGRDAGKLVPISFNGAQPPLGFRQLHTISFAGADDEAAFEGLIAAIDRQSDKFWKGRGDADKRVERNPILPAAGLLASPVKQPKSRLVRYAAAGAMLLAAIAAAVALFVRAPNPPPAATTAAPAAEIVRAETAPVAGAAVAVLPFRLASEAGGADAERLASDIEAALTRAPWLTVESSRSVASAAANETDVATMAATMNVAYLLDGELRLANDSARLTLQLMAAETGASVWSLSEEFPAQRLTEADFTEQLADAVWRNIYLAESARVRDARLETLAPRELLALALSGVRHAPWTEDGVREAIGVLAAAVSAYPDDAEVLATAAQADLTLSLIDPASAARLEKAAEERLAKAFLLNPQSRWVESVAADVNFAAGRYYAAAEGYDRLARRGYVLPATRAREIDARARVSGAFAAAAKAAEAEAEKAFTPLQRSQTHAAAAYASAAAGNDAAALNHARSAVAAFPNNPDAVMALVMMATLAGEDAALSESVRAFCNFYPSFDYPAPQESGPLRTQLEGDGGAEWRLFIARLFDAYAARWSVIDAACA